MIKVTVLYPSAGASRFDMRYYLERHIPMVQDMLGDALKGVYVDEGMSGEAPGSSPPFLAVTHLLFESVEQFYATFGPHDAAITADIPNYTDATPAVQISRVAL